MKLVFGVDVVALVGFVELATRQFDRAKLARHHFLLAMKLKMGLHGYFGLYVSFKVTTTLLAW